jgi:hypothetical protein
MAFNPIKSISHGVKSLTHNPVNWAKNALWEGTAKGFGFGHLDKAMGGSGTLGSTMRNPWMQAGAGVGLSFVPGMQWYAPLAVGAGMSALGGGNLEDDLRGAGMAGLGYGAGNLGQAAYSGAQGLIPSTTTTGGAAEGVYTPNGPGGPGAVHYGADGLAAPGTTDPVAIANEYGMEGGVGGYAPTPGDMNTVSMPATIAEAGRYEAAGLTPGSAPRAARVAPTPVGAPTPTGGGGVTGLGSGISGKQMLGIMGAKAGLGFYQNLQQQQALEDELKDRDELRRLQMQAMEDPMSVPGMRARRDLARDTFANNYRAKYGGTEGGAFAKGMARYTDAAVASGVNNYVTGLGGIANGTQNAQAYNIAAGGTPGGAAAGALNSAGSDFMDMYFLNQLYGRQ